MQQLTLLPLTVNNWPDPRDTFSRGKTSWRSVIVRLVLHSNASPPDDAQFSMAQRIKWAATMHLKHSVALLGCVLLSPPWHAAPPGCRCGPPWPARPSQEAAPPGRPPARRAQWRLRRQTRRQLVAASGLAWPPGWAPARTRRPGLRRQRIHCSRAVGPGRRPAAHMAHPNSPKHQGMIEPSSLLFGAAKVGLLCCQRAHCVGCRSRAPRRGRRPAHFQFQHNQAINMEPRMPITLNKAHPAECRSRAPRRGRLTSAQRLQRGGSLPAAC